MSVEVDDEDEGDEAVFDSFFLDPCSSKHNSRVVSNKVERGIHAMSVRTILRVFFVGLVALFGRTVPVGRDGPNLIFSRDVLVQYVDFRRLVTGKGSRRFLWHSTVGNIRDARASTSPKRHFFGVVELASDGKLTGVPIRPVYTQSTRTLEARPIGVGL